MALGSPGAVRNNTCPKGRSHCVSRLTLSMVPDCDFKTEASRAGEKLGYSSIRRTSSSSPLPAGCNSTRKTSWLVPQVPRTTVLVARNRICTFSMRMRDRAFAVVRAVTRSRVAASLRIRPAQIKSCSIGRNRQKCVRRGCRRAWIDSSAEAARAQPQISGARNWQCDS